MSFVIREGTVEVSKILNRKYGCCFILISIVLMLGCSSIKRSPYAVVTNYYLAEKVDKELLRGELFYELEKALQPLGFIELKTYGDKFQFGYNSDRLPAKYEEVRGSGATIIVTVRHGQKTIRVTINDISSRSESPFFSEIRSIIDSTIKNLLTLKK